jgi:hypothetical protein
MSQLRANSVTDLTGGVPAGVGRILQVVQTIKTDTFTTTSASFVTITGLSASITPSSTSSKILIMAQVTYGGGQNAGAGHFKITGGNTSGYVGDAASDRVRAVFGGSDAGITTPHEPAVRTYGEVVIFLDSPNTTSATTYQVEARQASNGTVNVNRSSNDGDNVQATRGASSITLMEVAG